MKRFFAALAALFILLPALPVSRAAGADCVITDASIEYVLAENGTAEAVVELELTVPADASQLELTLPEEASRIKAPGYRLRTDRQADETAVVLSQKGGFAAGTYPIRLEYRCDKLVSGADGGQLLTLPLLAAQHCSIQTLGFTVTLPSVADAQAVFTSGYAGAAIDDVMNWTKTGAVIAGRISEPLLDHDTLTVALTLPEGYFRVHIVRGDAFAVVFTVFSLLFAALGLVYWWFLLRNRRLHVRARTLPPDGINPGDVPYLLSGGNTDFSMLVSHWATLGYLSFYVNRTGHVILRKRMAMGNERRSFEQKLFGLLFGNEDYCDGASLRYKKAGQKAMEIVPRYWNKRLYEKKSGSPALARLLGCLSCACATTLALGAVAPETARGLLLCMAFVSGWALCWLMHKACGGWYLCRWTLVGAGVAAGILLLILGSIGEVTGVMLPVAAAAAFVGWQTVHGGLRTPYGSEVIAQTIGYRRFLRNASDQHLRQTLYRDPQYFYKMLPYAEAMGQGRRFASLLSEMELEPCQWYETAGKSPVTAGEFYEHYCETLAMLHTSIGK